MYGTRLASIVWPASILAGATQGGTDGEDQLWSWSAAAFDGFERFAGLLNALTALAREGYQQNPAVMLGLLALVVLPVLSPIGLLLRRDAHVLPAPDQSPEEFQIPERVSWIELEGTADSRHPLGYSMLRIGRQEDNELCIEDTSVHRYHAVIYHSPEGEVMVADIGGRQGNGIKVNGDTVEQAQLRPGDCLQVGKVKLRVGAGHEL